MTSFPLKIIVCGGRGFTDRLAVYAALDAIHRECGVALIIEGGQRTWIGRELVGGADYLAGQWALDRKVPCTTVDAQWHDLSHPDAVIRFNTFGHRYDAAAGTRRNSKMIELKPDVVIAFPGGRGTADMMRQARAADVRVIDIEKGDQIEW